MKKLNSKLWTLLSLVGVLCASLSLASCSGVIFYTIREEVELDDAVISGDIRNIVRYQLDGVENLFVTNGKIYCRSIDTEHDVDGNEVTDFNDSVAAKKIDWTVFERPSKGAYAMAADSANLYVLSLLYEDDDDGYNVATTRTLYCYSDGAWTSIWSGEFSSSTSAAIFCTNSPKNAHRKAYFRYGTTVYELNGTSDMTELATGDTNNATVPTTGVRACVYAEFDDNVYFTSNYAMTSNETTADPTDADYGYTPYIYYATGDNVYYTADGSWEGYSDLSCDTILSLAVTNDYLLAGTDEGIVHTTWASENIPSAGTADFSTNADSTLSSYYVVNCLLAVDPSRDETAGTLYGAIDMSGTPASLNNVGLWSYYAYKGKWNRE